jgi:hypothetical protein
MSLSFPFLLLAAMAEELPRYEQLAVEYMRLVETLSLLE